jgi:hypothetical protein
LLVATRYSIRRYRCVANALETGILYAPDVVM